MLVKSDKNVRNLEKFQNCLNQLKRGKHLDEDICERFRPFAAVTPTLYGLPKTHKEASPCRPVLASNDCFNYKCASRLNEIFNPLRQHQTNIKDKFEFVKQIQESSTKQNSIMVSFDVKSLFTNIPVDFVIDLILSKIYHSDLSKTFHGLTKRQLRTLLVWMTKRTIFNFYGNSYDQIDGIAMGSPIAPAFTDIFMNWIIEKTTEFSVQPFMFYGYVDYCFAVFPNRVSALKFYHDLNTIHKDVKFTYELEHNKQLAFLDVGLDNSTGSIELSVHRKPTHTGLYNKWEGLAPQKYKTNLIRNLLHRAYRICSNSRLLKNEI